ncbi:MAG: YesL family protein [Suilimivivens sp.]
MEKRKKKERQKIFASDSNFMYILTKAGQVIILNVIWLISCIPVFTVGTATTSLYYAMMKNIRRNRSYPTMEYFASFKRTLGTGSIFTAVFALWIFLLYHLRSIALATESATGIFLSRIYLTLMIVTAAVLVYLFPILSRFTMKMTSMVKLAFVMAVRYFGFTLIILTGTAVLFWLWFYYLPMPMIFVLPGAWCYVCTFMIEKALRSYMPSPSGKEDAWYYE